MTKFFTSVIKNRKLISLEDFIHFFLLLYAICEAMELPRSTQNKIDQQQSRTFEMEDIRESWCKLRNKKRTVEKFFEGWENIKVLYEQCQRDHQIFVAAGIPRDVPYYIDRKFGIIVDVFSRAREFIERVHREITQDKDYDSAVSESVQQLIPSDQITPNHQEMLTLIKLFQFRIGISFIDLARVLQKFLNLTEISISMLHSKSFGSDIGEAEWLVMLQLTIINLPQISQDDPRTLRKALGTMRSYDASVGVPFILFVIIKRMDLRTPPIIDDID